MSLPANAAEESYVLKIEPLTIKVITLNSELVRFEVRENGSCRKLGEGTGVYRFRDLSEQARLLDAKFKKFSELEPYGLRIFNLAAALAVGSYFFLKPTLEQFDSGWTYTSEGFATLAISHFASYLIFVSWKAYRLLGRKIWYNGTRILSRICKGH